jgi:CheY-like chemotaxis protein
MAGTIETVLLVDDEADLRTIGKLSLERVGGWRVLLAPGGEEGVALAASGRPDVILLDVMMPDMDGPTTLARLRERPETAAIPVIFMTAKAQKSEVERYLGLGARGVIAKPFEAMALPALVREIFNSAPPAPREGTPRGPTPPRPS